MSDPRPDLAEVRRQYQATEEDTVRYGPRVFGSIDIPFPDSMRKTVTVTEGQMLDRLTFQRGLVGLQEFAGIADRAGAEAIRRYPNQTPPATIAPEDRAAWQGNDGHRDAFRHAYWNALMTREYGEEWTKRFAVAHEGLPGNPANREAMDLYNNEVGRRIATQNPNATPQQLAALVGRAADNGELVVLDARGQLAWSDRVALGRHGLTPQETIDGRLPVPEPVDPASRGNTTSMVQPQSPDHPLYATARMAALDLERREGPGFPHDGRQIAEVATIAARQNGLDRVDALMLNVGTERHRPGETLFVVEGRTDDPAARRVAVPLADALARSPQQNEVLLADAREATQQREAALAQQTPREVGIGARMA